MIAPKLNACYAFECRVNSFKILCFRPRLNMKRVAPTTPISPGQLETNLIKIGNIIEHTPLFQPSFNLGLQLITLRVAGKLKPVSKINQIGLQLKRWKLIYCLFFPASPRMGPLTIFPAAWAWRAVSIG